MKELPRIAIIIGSTRDTRFADVPAQWFLQHANRRTDMSFELVDLRDHPMPFFNEATSNKHAPSKHPEVIRWQKRLAPYDGFVFIVAEYNHSLSGILKNALDQAYNEWVHKAFTAVGYGGVGAARAIEHLRAVATELQMVSTQAAVHISGADFMAIHPAFGKKPIEEIEAHLLPSVKTALDELSWWVYATKNARAADRQSTH